MTERVDPLRKLVQDRADELGITSARELTRRAGNGASYETVRRILVGKHSGRISDDVAAGLAKALSLPVARVREAAALPVVQGPWDWPTRFDPLDAGERQLVESFAAALLAAREKGRQAE